MIMPMRLTILYRENSEQARPVSEFVEMMRRQYPGRRARVVDINTREGAAEASIYGVVSYPAFIVTAEDGRVVQHWEGSVPLIGEVASLIDEKAPSRI